MVDPLRPFRVIRPGWHLLDLAGYWRRWLAAALWYWRTRPFDGD